MNLATVQSRCTPHATHTSVYVEQHASTPHLHPTYPCVVRRHNEAAEAPARPRHAAEQHPQHKGVEQREQPDIQIRVGHAIQLQNVLEVRQCAQAAAQRKERCG